MSFILRRTDRRRWKSVGWIFSRRGAPRGKRQERRDRGWLRSRKRSWSFGPSHLRKWISHRGALLHDPPWDTKRTECVREATAAIPVGAETKPNSVVISIPTCLSLVLMSCCIFVSWPGVHDARIHRDAVSFNGTGPDASVSYRMTPIVSTYLEEDHSTATPNACSGRSAAQNQGHGI